ncbi:MAG: beta-N-acetylglucosaminidase domain-containing protein [Prevotella sp.]|nr:beta-N-acetylglucosaminidase domain-containing protein [Prevotella sp.]
MKHPLLFSLLLSMAVFEGRAQHFENVYPTPQRIVEEEESMQIPKSVSFVYDPLLEGTYPVESLKGWLGKGRDNGKVSVIMGVMGDQEVAPFARRIPREADGYFLSVASDRIVLAGNDRRGLFYAVQTLMQSAENGRLPKGEVVDYPDVVYRGVVEGFYGTPWSFQNRLNQLDFYGRHKLNVYIYGPKDDPYHSVPDWRKPYPEKEAAQLKALVERANRNGVMFYWAIHPGQDIQWNDADRRALMAKLESVYQLGVRAFAVFFDDISGEGTKAEKQAELLNYIDNEFVKAKGDVASLLMCPTEYNRSWANIEGGYLPTLGNRLNDGIEIMWTGNKVVACIEKKDVEWINEHIRRNAYVWWNFPVSDYVRDHLLLGPVYGNATDIRDDVSGFLSNPMEHAEASKIALSSVADYTWNMAKYDSARSWQHGLKSTLPDEAEALGVFARHSSDLGKNDHGFRRNESENIAEALGLWETTGGRDKEAVAKVRQECDLLGKACDRLLASKSNPDLIEEMRPWVRMGKLVAEYGLGVADLQKAADKGRQRKFEAEYRRVRALQAQMQQLDSTENQNRYQPGVKVGSLALVPRLNAVFARLVKEYNAKNGKSLGC